MPRDSIIYYLDSWN